MSTSPAANHSPADDSSKTGVLGRSGWQATRTLTAVVDALSALSVMEFSFDETGGMVEKVPARDPLMNTGESHTRQDLTVDGQLVTSTRLINEQMSAEDQFLAALAAPAALYIVTVAPAPMGTGMDSMWGSPSSRRRAAASAPPVVADGAPAEGGDTDHPNTYEVTVTWGSSPQVQVRPSLKTMMKMQEARHGGVKVSYWSDMLVQRLHDNYVKR